MRIRIGTYKILMILALVCVGSFFAFDQKEDEKKETEVIPAEFVIPPLVQKELDLKLKKYENTILDKCITKALEAAETYIDSLVSKELKFQASDTLRFPAKPIRPELREPIILNDTTPIVPIFN